MATSGVYTFNRTRNEIIAGALRVLGVIAEEETPLAVTVSNAAEALNMMVKSWVAAGTGLWTRQDLTLFLQHDTNSYIIGPSGTHCTSSYDDTQIATAAIIGAATITVDDDDGFTSADYLGVELDDGTLQWTTVSGAPVANVITLGAVLTAAAAVDNVVYSYTTKAQRPLFIEDAFIRDVSGSDVPVDIVGQVDYYRLANKTSSGRPNQIYYDPKLTNGMLYVWPRPTDVSDTLHFKARYQIQDFVNIADNADFPVEWLKALKFNLAINMAPEYGVIGERYKIIQELAASSKQDAMFSDHEYASTVFMPSMGR